MSETKEQKLTCIKELLLNIGEIFAEIMEIKEDTPDVLEYLPSLDNTDLDHMYTRIGCCLDCIDDIHTAPSPQWTAEPPKEEGWYLYWHMNSVKTMLVKNTEVISSYYLTIPQVERFFKHNQTMLFCRIPIPPLPERKENHA